MRKIKIVYHPEGINHHRWMLFCDKDHVWHWRFFYGTGSLYEQYCQWSAILRHAGYNRERDKDVFAERQRLYSDACDEQERLGTSPERNREYNTALSPLNLERGEWQHHLGEFLWKLRLIPRSK